MAVRRVRTGGLTVDKQADHEVSARLVHVCMCECQRKTVHLHRATGRHRRIMRAEHSWTDAARRIDSGIDDRR